MTMDATWVLLILLSLLVLLLKRRKMLNRPPGPFPWPLVGNHFYLSKLVKKYGGQHGAFAEISKRYNSSVISLRFGFNDVIVVSDIKLILELWHREEFNSRPWNEFAKMRNMGMRKGITMNQGAEWKEMRTWTMQTLKKVGFARREMNKLVMQQLHIILDRLKEDGKVRCMSTLLAPAVMNILWIMVSGKPFDNAKLQYFKDLIIRRTEAFDMAGGLLSAFPWLRYIAPEYSGYNLLMQLNKELLNFLTDTIEEHKQRYTGGTQSDFIDVFLHEMVTESPENSLFTEYNLLITLVDFFLAGFHNTASMLDFLFLEMVNHRDVQRKLQQELDAVVGRDRLPTLEDRPRLPFTEATLSECLRLRYIIPIIGPRCVQEDTSLGGYTFRKNATVLVNAYSHNMNPEIYPEPNTFKPERFLKDGVYERDPYNILFGKGKRRCPGEALAKSSMFMLFVGVMHRYQLLPMPGEDFVKINVLPGLMLSLKPYEIRIVRR